MLLLMHPYCFQACSRQERARGEQESMETSKRAIYEFCDSLGEPSSNFGGASSSLRESLVRHDGAWDQLVARLAQELQEPPGKLIQGT